MRSKILKQIDLDATNKSLGRLASEIAKILQGKDEVHYLPNRLSDVMVNVKEIMKMKLTGKKESQKFLFRHSGYPRGLKKISIMGLSHKTRVDLLRHAVSTMLPKNTLRKKLIQRLKIL